MITNENHLDEEIKNDEILFFIQELVATKKEALRKISEYESIPLTVLKRAPSEIVYVIENWKRQDENSPITREEVEEMVYRVARGSRLLAIRDAKKIF